LRIVPSQETQCAGGQGCGAIRENRRQNGEEEGLSQRTGG
jgi:hypothetical protein